MSCRNVACSMKNLCKTLYPIGNLERCQWGVKFFIDFFMGLKISIEENWAVIFSKLMLFSFHPGPIH